MNRKKQERNQNKYHKNFFENMEERKKDVEA